MKFGLILIGVISLASGVKLDQKTAKPCIYLDET